MKLAYIVFSHFKLINLWYTLLKYINLTNLKEEWYALLI